MKDKIKNWTILALFGVIGILLLLQQCSSPKTKEVFLKGQEIIKYDTIDNTDTLVEFKTRYYPKYITIKSADTTWNADLCNFERTYNDTTTDSNITIYSNIETIGILKSNKLSYKWLKPEIVKNISRTDTLVKPSKWQFFLNTEVGGNDTKISASVGGTLIYKKVEFGANYGLLDKTYNVRIGYRLFKSKK